MFEFSSALSTVGLSCGIMNYNAPTLVLWTGIFGMFFGRLEIYVIILAMMQCRNDIKHHGIHC
jgi:trk system potassium uptake protein TrkH